MSRFSGAAEFTEQDYQTAKTVFSQHAAALEKDLFEQYSSAKQYLLLGQYLWLSDENPELAIQLLQQAITIYQQHPESLNQFHAGFLYFFTANALARQNAGQAAQHYQQAIELNYEDACVNYGVMYEEAEQFRQALEAYQACPEKLKTALLYLNLGTLYYNGKGVKTDRSKGAALWLKSYQLSPYEADINYNLGVYHFHETKDYAQSRYHFSACAYQDIDCSLALRNMPLINPEFYADKRWLDELQQLEGLGQQSELEDRLNYLMPEAYYRQEQSSDGLLFDYQIDEHGTIISVNVTAPIQASESSSETIEKGLIILNRAVYVDTFTSINLHMFDWQRAISNKRNLTFTHLGNIHKLSFTQEQARYEIQLTPVQ